MSRRRTSSDPETSGVSLMVKVPMRFFAARFPKAVVVAALGLTAVSPDLSGHDDLQLRRSRATRDCLGAGQRIRSVDQHVHLRQFRQPRDLQRDHRRQLAADAPTGTHSDGPHVAADPRELDAESRRRRRARLLLQGVSRRSALGVANQSAVRRLATGAEHRVFLYRFCGRRSRPTNRANPRPPAQRRRPTRHRRARRPAFRARRLPARPRSTWNASTDTGGSGLSGYEILRNNGGTPIGTSSSTVTPIKPRAGVMYLYNARAHARCGGSLGPLQ